MSIYISKALRQQYPAIAAKFTLPVEVDSSNLWIRDYFPIHTDGMLTKFKYKTDKYDRWPHLVVPRMCWESLPAKQCDIVLDGGNVEQNANIVLMTEIVFDHNPDVAKPTLIHRLEKLFGKKVILLPVEPGDDLGHIDGMVRFIDDRLVFVNSYTHPTVAQREHLTEVVIRLHIAGIDIELCPNIKHLAPQMTETEFRAKYPLADEFDPGFGWTINFLHSGDEVFVPVFGVQEDDAVLDLFTEHFPDHKIIPVNCAELSMCGGLVHCTTWSDDATDN
jgi:agmatine deiminase